MFENKYRLKDICAKQNDIPLSLKEDTPPLRKDVILSLINAIRREGVKEITLSNEY